MHAVLVNKCLRPLHVVFLCLVPHPHAFGNFQIFSILSCLYIHTACVKWHIWQKVVFQENPIGFYWWLWCWLILPPHPHDPWKNPGPENGSTTWSDFSYNIAVQREKPAGNRYIGGVAYMTRQHTLSFLPPRAWVWSYVWRGVEWGRREEEGGRILLYLDCSWLARAGMELLIGRKKTGREVSCIPGIRVQTGRQWGTQYSGGRSTENY